MPGPGRPFKKGEIPNPYGRAGKPRAGEGGPPEPVYDEPEKPEPPVADDDLPPSEFLRDFRWAYRNYGVRCRGTPQQMLLREMFEDERVKFLQAWQREEDSHTARVKEAAARRPAKVGTEPVALGKDEGLERAIEMCERWLADYAAREAAKGVV